MARKKRKKKEEYQFKTPKFDEASFMRREVEGAKAAMITIVYAFVVAVASWALTVNGLNTVGALAGFVALYGLRYLYPLARLDMRKFDWKLWAGNGAIYIFAWFAFWVLLLNPPFIDVAPPVIHGVEVPGANPDNPGLGELSFLTLGGNTSFQVLATVTDNQRLVAIQVQVTNDRNEEQSGPMQSTDEPSKFFFTVNAEPGRTYTFIVDAFDEARHQTTFNFLVRTS